MAKKSTLYLNTALQTEMEKRPNTVTDQLERLFNMYKYRRGSMETTFEDAELDLLLYAQKYGEWDDDPKFHFGLGTALERALDDREDFLTPNGAAIKVHEKVHDKLSEELRAAAIKLHDKVYDKLSEELRAAAIAGEIEKCKDIGIRLKAADEARSAASELGAQAHKSLSEERLEELKGWIGKLDELYEGDDYWGSTLVKLHEMHPFDVLTLIDALEQANKTEKPQRTIRYLLPGRSAYQSWGAKEN